MNERVSLSEAKGTELRFVERLVELRRVNSEDTKIVYLVEIIGDHIIACKYDITVYDEYTIDQIQLVGEVDSIRTLEPWEELRWKIEHGI